MRFEFAGFGRRENAGIRETENAQTLWNGIRTGLTLQAKSPEMRKKKKISDKQSGQGASA